MVSMSKIECLLYAITKSFFPLSGTLSVRFHFFFMPVIDNDICRYVIRPLCMKLGYLKVHYSSRGRKA